MMETFPIFFLSAKNNPGNTHSLEHALSCLETGWLYTLQSEFLPNIRDDVIKEQAIMYLERAIFLCEEVRKLSKVKGQTILKFSLNDAASYPVHVKALLEGHPIQFLHGSATYLLARIHQGWNDDREHQQLAFDLFCESVRTTMLPNTSQLWAEAHHRAATIAIKHPYIIDSDYKKEVYHANSDLNIEAAISHFLRALRCNVLSKTFVMDLHFHVAQAYIARLQLLMDKVPQGQSLTRALERDGLDTIYDIEVHLKEALKRVTAASNETVQEGYYTLYHTIHTMIKTYILASAVGSIAAIEVPSTVL